MNSKLRDSLDEILENLTEERFGNGYQKLTIEEAKQAILDWREQEIANYLSRIVESADSEGRIWAETIHEQIKKLRSKS